MQGSQLAGVFVQYFPTVARCGCAVLHYKAVAPGNRKDRNRTIFDSHERKKMCNRRITCRYSRIRSAVVSGNIMTAVVIWVFLQRYINENITYTRHERPTKGTRPGKPFIIVPALLASCTPDHNKNSRKPYHVRKCG